MGEPPNPGKQRQCREGSSASLLQLALKQLRPLLLLLLLFLIVLPFCVPPGAAAAAPTPPLCCRCCCRLGCRHILRERGIGSDVCLLFQIGRRERQTGRKIELVCCGRNACGVA